MIIPPTGHEQEKHKYTFGMKARASVAPSSAVGCSVDAPPVPLAEVGVAAQHATARYCEKLHQMVTFHEQSLRRTDFSIHPF